MEQGIKADEKIGSNIQKARKAKNLTQEQLSAKLQTYGCDISRGTLAKIKAGIRHISAEELKALKTALFVSYDDLFKDEPNV